MRLQILEQGHRLPARLLIRLAQALTGHPMDPVAKMAMHRPPFFGGPFLDLVADVLRGPSYWSPAEREYLAVFSSRLNECPFCVRGHTETTRVESGGAIDVDDPASLRPEVVALLPLLEKVSRSPEQVIRSDVDAVRARGVPDEAIVDALHVNLVFNCINRLANAFDFAWDSDDHARLGAKVIHRIRYKLPGFVMR